MVIGHASDRASFLFALEAELARDRDAVAIAQVNLDRFSRIREIHGAAVARLVRATLIGRLGALAGGRDHVMDNGEESFIVMLQVSGVTIDGLERLGFAMVDDLSAPVDVEQGLEIAVGCNVGLAAASELATGDALALLAFARGAVERADARGSRRVVVQEAVPPEQERRWPGLYADMLHAVRSAQFVPVFQPIVELPGRRVIGAESLVRWNHPDHGVLEPDEFLAESESSGLIREMDARLNAAAIAACASWGGALSVWVNTSAAGLDAPRLVDGLAAGIERAGLPADRVVVGVGESALSQDWPAARRRLVALRDVGVRVAVDGFGAGHLPLAALDDGVFDVIKLDRGILDPARSAGRPGSLLQAATALGRTLGLDVVAQGIETEDQARRAAEAGCNLGQGYLFGRPMLGDAFVGLIPARVR